MRSLSLNFRQAIFAQQSGEVALFLLTITHPNLVDGPIRLSSDPTQRLSTDPLHYGTQSRGETFLFVSMELQLPNEKENAAPATTFVIGNVDRAIVPLVRSINSPAQVLMEGLLASDPETVEFNVPQLDIVNVEWNAGELTFNLAMDALAVEPFPSGSFDPASFPGLYV